MRTFVTASPIGPLLLTAGVAGLQRLQIAPQEATGLLREERPADPVLTATVGQLAEYFAGSRTRFDLPLDRSRLTPFADRVLRALEEIGFGETISYAGLARRAGSPGGARAVGQVMAANPWPLIVPCHRVLAAGGELGGYSGGAGLPTKRWLLAFEGYLPGGIGEA